MNELEDHLWTTDTFRYMDYETLTLIKAGCGPAKCSWCHKLLGNVLGIELYQACAQHDVDYRVGGDEIDRLCSDVRFIANLLMLALSKQDWRNWIRVPVLFGYFFVVRYAGKKHFNYQILVYFCLCYFL